MQKFLQGATNHLAWVMVDATDFATPESALSAATTIKIYGMLNTAAGTNLVSSGTGSLTNDITHVGASATGIYTIALASADLSDASAAFYDMYVIHLSATGAARQTLVASGVRCDTSFLSNTLSNIYSMLSDTLSTMNSQFAVVSNYLSNASNYLSNASGILSDIRSDVSDMHSDLLVMSGILSDTYSAVILTQSLASDAHSAAVVTQALSASDLSDLRSAITAGPAGVVTASDISDIASAVWAAKYTAHSAASSFGSLFSDVYSRVGLIQSAASEAA